MEQQHRHEREGQREHTAAEEEIVQTEPVREVIPRIGQLTAANNLKLLCFRDASIGSGICNSFIEKLLSVSESGGQAKAQAAVSAAVEAAVGSVVVVPAEGPSL